MIVRPLPKPEDQETSYKEERRAYDQLVAEAKAARTAKGAAFLRRGGRAFLKLVKGVWLGQMVRWVRATVRRSVQRRL